MNSVEAEVSSASDWVDEDMAELDMDIPQDSLPFGARSRRSTNRAGARSRASAAPATPAFDAAPPVSSIPEPTAEEPMGELKRYSLDFEGVATEADEMVPAEAAPQAVRTAARALPDPPVPAGFEEALVAAGSLTTLLERSQGDVALEAASRLALEHLSAGRTDLAQAAIALGLSHTGSGLQRARLHRTRARILELSGDTEEASEAYRQALRAADR
jgi:hypothetical protein